MKRFLFGLIFLAALILDCDAANVYFAFTNSYTYEPDTNAFFVVAVNTNILSNGTMQTVGFPQMQYPNTNGVLTNTTLLPGFYKAVSPGNYFGSIVFAVPNDNSGTIWNAFSPPPVGLAVSGFNTYNFGLFTAGAIAQMQTNVFQGNLGFTSNYLYGFVATNTASSNAVQSLIALAITNYTSIVYSNPAAYLTPTQITNLVFSYTNAGGISAATGTNIAAAQAQLTGIASTNFSTIQSNGLVTFSSALTTLTSNALYTVSNIGSNYFQVQIPAQVGSSSNVNWINTGVASNYLSTNALASFIGVSNVSLINLQAASNALFSGKQPASLNLTNLSLFGALTNQIASGSGISFATNGSYVISLNVSNQTFLTNGLASTAFTALSNLVQTSQLFVLTNGFIGITNLFGYATTNFAISLTNGLVGYGVTNGFLTQAGAALIYYPTNNPEQFITTSNVVNFYYPSNNPAGFLNTSALNTNGFFLFTTNGYSYSQSVADLLKFGTVTNFLVTSNVISIKGSDQGVGTYILGNSANIWTNSHAPNYTVVLSGGVWSVLNNGTYLYTAPSVTGPWSLVPGSGTVTPPVGGIGVQFHVNGVQIIGWIASTNLITQIQTVGAQYFTTTNSVVSLIAQYGVNPTNGVSAVTATNIAAYQAYLSTNGITITGISSSTATNIATNSVTGGILAGTVANSVLSTLGVNTVIISKTGYGTNTILYQPRVFAGVTGDSNNNVSIGVNPNFSSGTQSTNNTIIGYGNQIGGSYQSSYDFIAGNYNTNYSVVSTYDTMIGYAGNLFAPDDYSGMLYATIAGGSFNTISNIGSSFPQPSGANNAWVAGQNNLVTSSNTFALGSFAYGSNANSFIWSDSTAGSGALRTTIKTNTFIVYAHGGLGINTNNPGTNALEVSGYIDTTQGFSINGVPFVGGGGGSATNAIGNNNGYGTNATLYFGTSVSNTLINPAISGDVKGNLAIGTNNTVLLYGANNIGNIVIGSSNQLQGIVNQNNSIVGSHDIVSSNYVELSAILGTYNTIYNPPDSPSFLVGDTLLGGFNTVSNIGSSFGNNEPASYSLAAGYGNLITRSNSFALGTLAAATNEDSFIWSDGHIVSGSMNSTFVSNSAVFFVQNGFSINTNNPGTNSLEVQGNIDSTVGFSVNGVPIVSTGISQAALSSQLIASNYILASQLLSSNAVVLSSGGSGTNNSFFNPTITNGIYYGNGAGLTNLSGVANGTILTNLPDTIYLTNYLTGIGGTNSVTVINNLLASYTNGATPQMVKLVFPATGTNYLVFTNTTGITMPANSLLGGLVGPQLEIYGSGQFATRLWFPNITNNGSFALGCTNKGGLNNWNGTWNLKVHDMGFYGPFFAGVNSSGYQVFNNISNAANGIQFGWADGGVTTIANCEFRQLAIMGFMNGVVITNGVQNNFYNCIVENNGTNEFIFCKNDNATIYDCYVGNGNSGSINGNLYNYFTNNYALWIPAATSDSFSPLGNAIVGGQWNMVGTVVKDDGNGLLTIVQGNYESEFGTNWLVDKLQGAISIMGMNVNLSSLPSWQFGYHLGSDSAARFFGANCGITGSGTYNTFEIDGALGTISYPNYSAYNAGSGNSVGITINHTNQTVLPSNVAQALNGSLTPWASLKLGGNANGVDNYQNNQAKQGQLTGASWPEAYTWDTPLLTYYSVNGATYETIGFQWSAATGVNNTNGSNVILFGTQLNNPSNVNATWSWGINYAALGANAATALIPNGSQDIGLSSFGAYGVRNIYVTNATLAGQITVNGSSNQVANVINFAGPLSLTNNEGSSGQVLTSGGAGNNSYWSTASGGSTAGALTNNFSVPAVFASSILASNAGAETIINSNSVQIVNGNGSTNTLGFASSGANYGASISSGSAYSSYNNTQIILCTNEYILFGNISSPQSMYYNTFSQQLITPFVNAVNGVTASQFYYSGASFTIGNIATPTVNMLGTNYTFSGTGSFTNGIIYPRRVAAKTANYTLGFADSGRIIFNTAAAGPVTNSYTAGITNGVWNEFYVKTAQNVAVKVPAGCRVIYRGQTSVDGGLIYAAGVGMALETIWDDTGTNLWCNCKQALYTAGTISTDWTVQ